MALESLIRTDTYSAKIARQIRIRLAELGQNQARLARALGAPPMWVSERLSGAVQISANDLPRFAEALGVDVADLLPGAGRGVTAHYSTDKITAVPGHFAMPDHPMIAGAVRLPVQVTRAGVLSGTGQHSGPYSSSRKTAPTGL